MADSVAALKQQGNDELRAGHFARAVELYTQALKLDPASHIVLSNRSAAQLRLQKPAAALEDALQAIQLAPQWAKAYSRAAMAYKAMDRLDDAEAIARVGLTKEPGNDVLMASLREIEHAKVVQQLRGAWHGKVAEEIGGYVQVFDFIDAHRMKIVVLGTEVEAQYVLNVDAKPYPHLDMSVPSATDSPVIRHIYRFAGPDELHLCSPYLAPADSRPGEFAGAGFVSMTRGLPVESAEDAAARVAIERMTESDKVLEFIRQATEVIPDLSLHQKPSDTEEVRSQRLASSVRFQTAYFSLAARFGAQVDQYVKELVIRMREPPAETPEIAKAVDVFRDKLQAAGLLDPPEDAAEQAHADLDTTKADTTVLSESAPATAAPPPPPPQPKKPSKPAAAAPSSSAAPSGSPSSDSIALVVVGAVLCAAAGALLVWSRPGTSSGGRQ